MTSDNHKQEEHVRILRDLEKGNLVRAFPDVLEVEGSDYCFICNKGECGLLARETRHIPVTLLLMGLFPHLPRPPKGRDSASLALAPCAAQNNCT